MKKLIFLGIILAAALLPCHSYAQKKVVKEAKSFLKTENFKKAEEAVNKAIQHPDTKDLAETWDLAGNIYKKWGESENMKAYLKKKYDTIQLYKNTLKMTEAYMKCDDLAQIPNEKGKIKNKYRSDNAYSIARERLNLVNGGLYYINLGTDQGNKTALDYLGAYINSASHPMMASRNLLETDSLIPQVAYYTCIAAMRIKDYPNVIKYAPYADKNPKYGDPSTQLQVTAYQQVGDTVNYLTTLIDGFKKYPRSKFYFANIVSYYLNIDHLDEALRIADAELEKKPNDSYNLFVKGYIYEVMERYDEAIDVFNQSIAADSTNAEAHSNLGLVYCLQAQDYADKATSNINDPNYEKDQEIIRNYYRKALEPYETARELKPEEKDLWLNGLYRVYYNLNLGEQFKEIESLMQ